MTTPKTIHKGTPNQRSLSVIEISRARDSRYLPQLLQRLQHETSPDTRRHIVRALGRLQDKSAISALRQVLMKETGNIVGDAARSLGELNATELIPVLEKLVSNRTQWIANQARWALKKMTPNKHIEHTEVPRHDGCGRK